MARAAKMVAEVMQDPIKAIEKNRGILMLYLADNPEVAKALHEVIAKADNWNRDGRPGPPQESGRGQGEPL